MLAAEPACPVRRGPLNPADLPAALLWAVLPFCFGLNLFVGHACRRGFSMRKILTHLTAIIFVASLCPAPRAHAASKEMIQLQTQVQTLQDMLQRLQQSNDERMGVLQHLVEQTADNVNRMSQAMNSLQQAVQAQGEGGNKVEQLSGQMQSMNDSVDELKSRIGRLDKTMQDIQAQLQHVSSQQAGGGGM